MFEKDAIRYAFENTIGIECLDKPVEDFSYEELSDELQEKAFDFKEGAEFGYNKANEWHYVKDGLPTNTGLYLIFYYNSFFNDKVRCIARYSPDRKEFMNLNIGDGDEVIAWQELPAPPKEIE